MAAIDAIVNIATSAIVLALLIFALRRNPTLKVYYFFILGIAVSIAGSVIVLVVPNTLTSFAAPQLAYAIANCIFILGIAYLVRVWLKSVEWEIDDRMARRLRAVTLAVYIIVPLATAGLIANMGMYLGRVSDDVQWGAVEVALTWLIAAVLGAQAVIVAIAYFRESKGVAAVKRSQLLRLVLFAGLMFIAYVIYAIAYWVPAIAPAAYVVMFFWLAVLVWPGALSGFDKDVEGGGAGAARRNDVELNGGARNTRASPFAA